MLLNRLFQTGVLWLAVFATPGLAQEAPPVAAPATFSYPKEIIQGENYVILPVTTPLQRELLATGDGTPDETLQAYLQVNGEAFLQRDGLIDPSALNVQELRLHLRKYSDRRRGALQTRIILGSSPDRNASGFLSLAMNGLGSSMGFQKSTSSTQFLGSSSDPGARSPWQRSLDFFPVIEGERVIDAEEEFQASEHFRAAPIRTTLSRSLTSGSSCVTVWPTVIKTSEDLPTSEPLIAELKTLIDKLDVHDRARLSLHVTVSPEPAAREVMDAFNNGGRDAYARALGFELVAPRSSFASR